MILPKYELKVLQDFARETTKIIVSIGKEYISSNGIFNLVLSGGNTPKEIYACMVSKEFNSSLDWSKVSIFFTDERCVPPSHERSNYRLVKSTLLEKLPIKNCFRMKGELGPDKGAEDYNKTLKNYFSITEPQLPSFDLIVAGVGPDGHTASIFPGFEELGQRSIYSIGYFVPQQKENRISLTYPILNASKNLIILAKGKTKIPILVSVLSGQSNSNQYPVSKLELSNKPIVWLVDQNINL